jgi:hypothetical protein
MSFRVVERTVVAEGFLSKDAAEDWASSRLIEDECQHWFVEELVEDDDDADMP